MSVCMMNRHKEAEQVPGSSKAQTSSIWEGAGHLRLSPTRQVTAGPTGQEAQHMSPQDRKLAHCVGWTGSGPRPSRTTLQKKMTGWFCLELRSEIPLSKQNTASDQKQIVPSDQGGVTQGIHKSSTWRKTEQNAAQDSKSCGLFPEMPRRCSINLTYGKCLMKNAVHTPQGTDDDNPLQNAENQRPKIFSVEKH